MTAINLSRVRRRFSRAAPTYAAAARGQRAMARRLMTLLPDLCPEAVLEIGCGTGSLTELLLERFGAPLTVNDLSPDMLERVRERFPREALRLLPGDIAAVALPEDYDLIISSAVLQWCGDLRGVLSRLAARLRPGGCLAAALFADGHFHELKALTGRGLAYPSAGELRLMLEELGLKAEVTAGLRTVFFPDLRTMLRHFSLTGVNALSPGGLWTASGLRRLERAYFAAYGDRRGLRLTWRPLYAVAVKAGS